ncbi:hypothetical protein V2J09_015990 [Rumex salicifolius]
MNVLFWNCWGANKPNFRRSIRYLVKRYETHFLALFETHAAGSNAARICQNLGFDQCFRVDAQGHSGGIWLLWRNTSSVITIVNSSNQFIHATVDFGEVLVHLVAVYAAPSPIRRRDLWGELESFISGVSEPVFIGGDFNTIVRLDERMGGNGHLSPDSLEFGEWINRLSLVDLGFKGQWYTWFRGRDPATRVVKRLDRVLCCAQGRLRWQEASVSHAPFMSSDHTPLHFQLIPRRRCNAARRPFRFEAAWLRHEDFKALLSASWNSALSTPEALNQLRVRLRRWNREVFGNIQNRKNEAIEALQGIRSLIELTPSGDLLRKEMELEKEIDRILEQEEGELGGVGRSKHHFFHTSTIIRRRRNRIDSLRGEDGRWEKDEEKLEEMATDYFQRLYSLDESNVVISLPRSGFQLLSESETTMLNAPFDVEEIRAAVMSMGGYKAPGPDGYQPIFYQNCWDIVGASVVEFVLNFFRSGVLPDSMNDVLVVLIARVAKPERIQQFRPISLCNVLFKTITKTMVNRLKGVIGKLMGDIHVYVVYIDGVLAVFWWCFRTHLRSFGALARRC